MSEAPARQGPPDPRAPGAWKVGFGRRLGYYALGITIGLMMLGFFEMAKKWARQQQAMQQPVQQQPAQQPAGPPQTPQQPGPQGGATGK